MELENAISGIRIKIPSDFVTTVKFVATCEPTKAELDAINRAFTAFQKEITENPPPKVSPLPTITVIITDSDWFQFRIDDNPEVWGLEARLILLPVHRWRRNGMKSFCMTLVTLEELCHALYLIDDEILVKYKVLDCYRHILPNVQLGDLYNAGWKD